MVEASMVEASMVEVAGVAATAGVVAAQGTAESEAATRRVVCGEWVSPHLAGGCPNHVTWRDNPQYVLSLSRNLAVFAPSFTLTITQSDLASGAAPQTVGLFVAYGVEAEPLREGRPNYACKATPCKTGQPMTLEVNFTPCGGNACYIVVPFTFEPGVEAVLIGYLTTHFSLCNIVVLAIRNHFAS